MNCNTTHYRANSSSVPGDPTSQFITLYVTPAIYLYLEDFQEKVLDRTSFFRSSHKQMTQPPVAPRPVLVRAEDDGNGNGSHE